MQHSKSPQARPLVSVPRPHPKNAFLSVKLYAFLRVFAMALFALFVPLSPPVWAEEQAISVRPEPSTLLVRVTKTARMIGYPAVCPGTDPADAHEDDICMAELYEAKAHVLKNLGGPETVRDLTIRFTAHSFHVVWHKDVRFLLVVSPFEDKGAKGHFASYWDWENESGEFCRDSDAVLKEDWEPLMRAFSAGKKHITKADDTHWSLGTEVICITGREKDANSHG